MEGEEGRGVGDVVRGVVTTPGVRIGLRLLNRDGSTDEGQGRGQRRSDLTNNGTGGRPTGTRDVDTCRVVDLNNPGEQGGNS